MFGLITRLECYHINLAESLVLALEKHNILRRNDEMVSFNQCPHYNTPQSKPLIRIENAVASATIDQLLDLKDITKKC